MIRIQQNIIQNIVNNAKDMNASLDILTRILITDVSYPLLTTTSVKKADKHLHKTEIAIAKQTEENNKLMKIFNTNKFAAKDVKTISKFEEETTQRTNQINHLINLFATLPTDDISSIHKQSTIDAVNPLLEKIQSSANNLIKDVNNTLNLINK